jgi:hypothetical protein
MRTFGGARIEDMVRCNATFAIRLLRVYHMSWRLRGAQVCRVK